MLFRFFNRKKRSRSSILIDLSARSISGGYALFDQGKSPRIIYARKVPIERRENEPVERALVRALAVLADDLIHIGAPRLRELRGRGDSDFIVTSINSPWQTTSVEREHIEKTADFIFTKGMVRELLSKRRKESTSENVLTDNMVLAVSLNGYDTKQPYGKRAHRATITFLTSCIKEHIAQLITQRLGALFHTKKIFPVAGNALRYQAVRELFPHDTESLLIDVIHSEVLSLALTHKGTLCILNTASVAPGEQSWTLAVTHELSVIAQTYPLPRTIFLIAPDDEALSLRDEVCSLSKTELWLSEVAPKIVLITSSVLASRVLNKNEQNPNAELSLMALYHEKKIWGVGHLTAEEGL